MSLYTELLDETAETLSPEDDDYEEKLLEIAGLFRGFGDAFTAFLIEHGYKGDCEDSGQKAKYVSGQYKSKKMEPPRGIKRWFEDERKPKRDTAFLLCFAFRLSVTETNEFFRCVRYERGIDCHTICEAVYYFCLKNRLSYSDAEEMLAQIPVSGKRKKLPDREVLYTGTIIDCIDSMKDKEQLIQYIISNQNDFQYNNATAIHFVQKLWNDIAKEDGLAVKEGSILERSRNRFENRRKKGVSDPRSADVIAKEVEYQEKVVKQDDTVIASEGSSTWTIFAQMIGLTNHQEGEFALKHDRSIASVLNANALLPLTASYCFPGQHSIDRLLRGEMADNELMRKMLIFLAFYSYWAKIVIRKDDAFCIAGHSDSVRSLYSINKYLMDAGYPCLYSGNPFDWLFLWSLNDKYPLEAFRFYMGEVFACSQEQDENVCDCKTRKKNS